MNIQTLTNYFLEYGAFFIYLIVLLEYLNLPGFPAGVIMPLAGIWAAKGDISFPLVMVLTVLAGLTGSWLLYFLGRLGGPKVMGWYFKKFPKHRAVIEEKMEMLREKGGKGVFVSKLLPMVRTIISIPAGMVQMEFMKYTVSSLLGIFIWNLVFVGAGYFFGEAAIQVLS
ncbi:MULTISPECIES: DedA family protein [Lachnospiraceae]|uniref:DedA family protein n=1 Tax=Faecalicatena acetigenes TaxID=2981790 RepID=A0ABT2T9Q9_9FIRM|nr:MULTISPECIES: DedA family protein [Lachnospiraceae]MCU6746977.1 DedA family protein [Faecalicatena acetigenes]SCH56881.1 SNARE associated Golgi protein [uncultured Clostridium sp.]